MLDFGIAVATGATLIAIAVYIYDFTHPTKKLKHD